MTDIQYDADGEPEFEVIVDDAELTVTPGTDATLSCRATGNVANIDRIEWQREDGELPPGITASSLHLVVH